MRSSNEATRAPLSPVAVRDDLPDPDKRLLQLAAELAPVILIMDRLGLTAFGYQVASAEEIHLYRDRETLRKVPADRLERARDAIRAAAGNQLPVIPNAVIICEGLGITLLGDERVGEMPDGQRLISPSTELPN